MRSKDDILCRNTNMFDDPLQASGSKKNKQDYDKDKAQYNEQSLKYIDHLLQQEDAETSVPSFSNETGFSLHELQNKGPANFGFKNISSIDKQATSFPLYTDDNPYSTESATQQSIDSNKIYSPVSKSDLVEVMLERTIQKHSVSNMSGDYDNSASDDTQASFVIEATGSPESIHLWAKQAFPKDRQQQRGFEILVAKFVLTYCSEADNSDNSNDTLSGTGRQEYLRCKRLLQEMVGRPVQTG